ncbi:Leukocyte receptor cluster member 9 [Paragonimus heterotremus]|uniref:Leukocyte receptor cluster member 9 n=1 Tax=Paragonimus heterotremus TaxID=100268 RepID=A0A8J4WRC6_9TREM|nr:Leukocyte receptor cluster member 9 [Paragonimus heterotremus]
MEDTESNDLCSDNKETKPISKNDKRPSMRTAMEVVKRIMWDDRIPEDCITIGYEDRFLGIVEKPFDAFSWEPLESLDYYTFGIPEHRIQYFKYKHVVVWDKRVLLDNVYGSLGSGLTIYDVMEKCDSLPTASAISDRPGSDESDDGVVVVADGGSEPVPDVPLVHDSTSDDGEDEKFWQNKLRPNFFICFRVDSPEIIQQVEVVQKHICSSQTMYERCCIPPVALHVTLRTLRLHDASHVSECVHALNQAKDELEGLLPNEPLLVSGLKNFHNRVVYAAVQPNEQLSAFVDHLDLVLRAAGLSPSDGRDFVPHITLVKLRRPVARQLQTKRIDPSLYEDFVDCSFGSQLVNTIYLCSMEKTRDPDGFYVTPAHVTFMRHILQSNIEPSPPLTS